jgi:hypothetical protein
MEREPISERRPSAAPFDHEAPRPRRPPAPLAIEADARSAPFDGERDGSIARAA